MNIKNRPLDIDPDDLARLREEMGAIPENWERWEIVDEIAKRKAKQWLDEVAASKK